MSMFTEQEKEAIVRAINDAEQQTSCEFVVTEIAQCDDYKSAWVMGGVMTAFILALLVHIAYPVNVFVFMCIEITAFIIGLVIFGAIPDIKRLLIPARKMRDEVYHRALAEFYAQGLYKTKDENGILILVAVFERMVFVLGDKGVNNWVVSPAAAGPNGAVAPKVATDYWEKNANIIATGIRAQKAGATIIETIRTITNDLKIHFPLSPDDKGELSNQVISK